MNKKKVTIIVIAALIIIGAISSLTDNNDTTSASSTNVASPSTIQSEISDSETTIPTIEAESENIEQESKPDEKPFVETYDNEIVVSASMLIERFVTNYKIPLAPQLWTIADFDENGAIMAITDITEKTTKISEKVIIILTPEMDGDKMIGSIPHYISVGNIVYGDDGYCDEFFSNIEEFLHAQ